MKFQSTAIYQIADIICSEKLAYDCTIIIGDNSSGKSFLVKELVSRWKENVPVYFIDAVNRGFQVAKVTSTKEKPEYKSTIVNTRLREEYFNVQDSFSCYGTSTERVEQIYSAFETQVQRLFKSLTGDEFCILYGDPLGEVQFPAGRAALSSGYQALIRMLLELVYYDEMEIKKKECPSAYVVIDEADEFLSPHYAAQILGFLRNYFPKMKFTVTTHSIDLVTSAQDANMIILDQDGYEVMDANDYVSYSEVQMIFSRVFGNRDGSVPEVEKTLRRLLNNKMNHAWSEEDEKMLKRLEGEKLTPSQRLIRRQILEW